MRPHFSTRLRSRLALLVLVSMLPLFAVLVHRAVAERNRKLQELREQAARISELAAGSIGQTVEGTRQMLLTLVHTDAVRLQDSAAAGLLFSDLLKRSAAYHNIGMMNAAGDVIGNGIPLSTPVNLGDRAWFRRLKEPGEFTIGGYQIGRITGKPSLNFALALPEPQRGALFAAMNLAKVQSCISSLPSLPLHTVILVLDRNGTYLARNPDPGWVGHTARSWRAFQAKGASTEGFVEAVGVDNTPRLYHYTAVPGSSRELFVAVGVSKAVVDAECQAELLHGLFWLGVSAGVSLLAASLLANISVLQPLRRLGEASRQLAANNWNVRAEAGGDGGVRELQDLARTFDSMAAAVRHHNEQLETEVEKRTAELTSLNRTLENELAAHKQMKLTLQEKEAEREAIIAELQEALAQVKTLHGLLPICSGCKKIRDDQGYWSQIEHYISAHSTARFSHGLCPECTRKYFPDLQIDWENPGKSPR